MYFQIGMNGLYLPLNQANAISSKFTMIGAVASSSMEPAGFPQLTNLYNAYRVTSFKIQISFAIEQTVDTCHFACYPTPAGANAVGSTLQQIANQMYSGGRVIALGALTKENTFSRTYQICDCLGLSKRQYMDLPVTIANVSQAVSEEVILQCVIQTANNAGSTAQLYMKLDVWYGTEWSMPQLITVS
jgi:hypothetical protein